MPPGTALEPEQLAALKAAFEVEKGALSRDKSRRTDRSRTPPMSSGVGFADDTVPV